MSKVTQTLGQIGVCQHISKSPPHIVSLEKAGKLRSGEERITQFHVDLDTWDKVMIMLHENAEKQRQTVDNQESKSRNIEDAVLSKGVKYNARLEDNCQKKEHDLKAGGNWENPAKIFQKKFTGQGKTVINCDWLQFRCVQTTMVGFHGAAHGVAEFGRYRLVQTSQRAGIYSSEGDVFYRPMPAGKMVKIGHLSWDARMAVHAGTMNFKVENWLFYDQFSRDDLGNIIQGFLNEICSEILNISRLDICVDGVNFHPLLDGVKNASKFLQVGRKTIVRNERNAYTDDVELFYVGASKDYRKGIKYGVYYNKSREIRVKNHKPYITNYFVQNGFDVTDDIWRFEVVCKAEALAQFTETSSFAGLSATLRSILHPVTLAKILEAQIQNWFEFVSSIHSDSKISRRPRVPLFDFRQLTNSKFVRVKPSETEPSNRTAKIRAKQLFVEAATSDLSMFLPTLKVAKNIVEKNALRHWLDKKTYIIQDAIVSHSKKFGKDIHPLFMQKKPVEIFDSMMGGRVPVGVQRVSLDEVQF